MPKILVVLAVAVLLTGCASSRALPSGKSKRWQQEHVAAACLKARGIEHVPWAPDLPTPTAEQLRHRQGDHTAMRAYRDRYGHGVFARLVHPEVPSADGSGTWLDDGFVSALSEPHSACYVQAVKQVLGRDVTDVPHFRRQYERAVARARQRELDTDPRLVELARDYAACMAGRGYPVAPAPPSTIATAERDRFAALLRDNPALTPEQAEPYFHEEIAAALDDLECGGDFFRVYNPRAAAVSERVAAEWGMAQ
ncbi:hypothetical protein [Nonomuraea sp. NPDC048916]|uniref:hypothetical protein n=1 Tax=Nonomuraea sp. NPDC048916 TaxID=3154232 RepID=UPI0033F0DC6A